MKTERGLSDGPEPRRQSTAAPLPSPEVLQFSGILMDRMGIRTNKNFVEGFVDTLQFGGPKRSLGPLEAIHTLHIHALCSWVFLTFPPVRPSLLVPP